MRRLNFNTISLFSVCAMAFLAGYFIRQSGLELSGNNLAKGSEPKVLAGALLPNKAAVSKQDKLIFLSPANQTNKDQQANAFVAGNLPVQPVTTIEDRRSAAELMALIELQARQGLSHDEIRSHPEFDLLVSRLQADSSARLQLLQQFMKVSGSPLGRTLSQVLAMSSLGTDSPELKAAALQLLRDGSTEQRLNALQILGSVGGNEQLTRARVLDVLSMDANTNPTLAIAALSTLNRQGVVSQADRQAVLKTVFPFTKSSDPQVRNTSLQMLSLWAGSDPAALQTFTEAASDADLNVRSFAVSALGQGKFTYPQVRDTLLSVLQNPDENVDVKASAQQVLEAYPLDEQALAVYQAHVTNPQNQAPTAELGFN